MFNGNNGRTGSFLNTIGRRGVGGKRPKLVQGMLKAVRESI
jgi:hypothetical protein